LEQDGEFVAEPDQKNEVNEEPCKPRGKSRELESPHLGDGGGAANGGHGPLVPVIKWRSAIARAGAVRDFLMNQISDVAGHLHGSGADARHRFSRFVHDEGHVADGEHFRMVRKAEVREDIDSACAIQGYVEFRGEWRRGDSGGPDNVFSVNGFVIVQSDATARDGFDAGGGFHLDTQGLELVGGAGAELGCKMSQKTARAFNNHHACLAGVNAAEVLLENVAGQFGKSAGELDPRGSAAHNHDGHQAVALRSLRQSLCFFKGDENLAANADGVVEGFEAGSELLPFGVAEVAGHAAKGEDEIIVFERGTGEGDNLVCEIKVSDLLHQDTDVRVV